MVIQLEIMSSDGKCFLSGFWPDFSLAYLFLFCFLSGAGKEENERREGKYKF